MKFTVTFTETVTYTNQIEAKTAQEALEIAQDQVEHDTFCVDMPNRVDGELDTVDEKGYVHRLEQVGV